MLYLINETFFDKTTREVIDLLKIGYTGKFWEFTRGHLFNFLNR